MNIKFKLLSPDAKAPQIMRSGDAGADIVALTVTESDQYIEYGTGVSVEIPLNHVGLLAPRSSLSNYDLILANHVGVIDSNFRGELKFRFKKAHRLVVGADGQLDAAVPKIYAVGERIGQLVIVPIPEVKYEEVSELSDSNRGTAGYGSSDLLPAGES